MRVIVGEFRARIFDRAAAVAGAQLDRTGAQHVCGRHVGIRVLRAAAVCQQPADVVFLDIVVQMRQIVRQQIAARGHGEVRAAEHIAVFDLVVGDLDGKRAAIDGDGDLPPGAGRLAPGGNEGQPLLCGRIIVGRGEHLFRRFKSEPARLTAQCGFRKIQRRLAQQIAVGQTGGVRPDNFLGRLRVIDFRLFGGQHSQRRSLLVCIRIIGVQTREEQL